MNTLKMKKKETFIYLILSLLWISCSWALSYYNQEYKIISVAVAIVLAIVTLLVLGKTSLGAEGKSRLLGIKQEVLKISWASLTNTKSTMIMVTALVALFSIILWFIDTMFTGMIQLML
jgi:preprotein translocase SecE subunit